MAAHIRPLQDPSERKLDPIAQFNKARAEALPYYQQFPYSRYITFKSEFQNLHLTLADTPSVLYGQGNFALLTDGEVGDLLFPEKAWLGFQGTNLDATIDLKKETPIEVLHIFFLRDHAKAIFTPKMVQLFASTDGETWTLLEDQDMTWRESKAWQEGPAFSGYHFSFSKKNPPLARYLRIFAPGFPSAPEWHFHKGKPAWLFVSEISINPQPRQKLKIPCPKDCHM